MTGLVQAAASATLMLLALAAALAFVRLARGPTLADRVIALDLIATVAAAIAAVFTVSTGESVFLRITVVATLIAFLGTVAMAAFIERGPSE